MSRIRTIRTLAAAEQQSTTTTQHTKRKRKTRQNTTRKNKERTTNHSRDRGEGERPAAANKAKRKRGKKESEIYKNSLFSAVGLLINMSDFMLLLLVVFLVHLNSGDAWRSSVSSMVCQFKRYRSSLFAAQQSSIQGQTVINSSKISKMLASFAIGMVTIINTAHADEQVIKSNPSQTFLSDEGHYMFRYSDDLVLSPKLVKTHKLESFLKSDIYKGFNVGITVDPVKINNVREFTSPMGLAERVLAVERSKEGFIDGAILSAKETVIKLNDDNVIPVYDLDYRVETPRGLNHFIVRSTIYQKRLYVFTVQCKEDMYNNLSGLMQEIAASLSLQ